MPEGEIMKYFIAILLLASNSALAVPPPKNITVEGCAEGILDGVFTVEDCLDVLSADRKTSAKDKLILKQKLKNQVAVTKLNRKHKK